MNIVNVVTNLKVKSALFRGIDNLVEFTKYIRTAEGTLDGYAADAQGEGDGGDGLRRTGRRRWRGWVTMHGVKATNENV
ncbi:hypothetical protein GOBAR_AA36090 [Gossypium barbadense]|uniref:Uncharacterized protein n=1 Tax=Gossypium barbadense TaxID=3634 RepID=A0A2P5W0J2_GOSBA|nr:hypothetical protein GOBAR_AA36090 [Gossypium barbadense]